MTAPRLRRGASFIISAAEIATQPAVCVRPSRARWKKIALPRPWRAARNSGRARRSHRRDDPRATSGRCSRALAGGRAGCIAGSTGPRTSPDRDARASEARPPLSGARGRAGNSPIAAGTARLASPCRPSRLMRTIPAGPSAQGTRNGPAVSQPRARFPASGRTRNCDRRRVEFITIGSLKMVERRDVKSGGEHRSPRSRYAHG